MQQPKDLILTWMSGDKFCQSPYVKVFIKSLKRVENADVVCFTHQMPSDIRTLLKEESIIVRDVPPETVPFILRDRYMIFWDYLLDHGDRYRYVLSTDSKDVLVQRNPFDWVAEWKKRFDKISGRKNFLDRFVIFVSEGFQMKDSPWNKSEQFEFQRDILSPFMISREESWVLNSGVCLGTPDAIKNYFFLLWAVAIKNIGQCTDQACLNYLYNYLKEDETYSVTQPAHDTFCLTGEAIKEGFLTKTEFRDGMFGLVRNGQFESYFLVHQWDRLENADKVLSQFQS